MKSFVSLIIGPGEKANDLKELIEKLGIPADINPHANGYEFKIYCRDVSEAYRLGRAHALLMKKPPAIDDELQRLSDFNNVLSKTFPGKWFDK
jgi:hypothetical protein